MISHKATQKLLRIRIQKWSAVIITSTMGRWRRQTSQEISRNIARWWCRSRDLWLRELRQSLALGLYNRIQIHLLTISLNFKFSTQLPIPTPVTSLPQTSSICCSNRQPTNALVWWTKVAETNSSLLRSHLKEAITMFHSWMTIYNSRYYQCLEITIRLLSNPPLVKSTLNKQSVRRTRWVTATLSNRNKSTPKCSPKDSSKPKKSNSNSWTISASKQTFLRIKMMLLSIKSNTVASCTKFTNDH